MAAAFLRCDGGTVTVLYEMIFGTEKSQTDWPRQSCRPILWNTSRNKSSLGSVMTPERILKVHLSIKPDLLAKLHEMRPFSRL